MSRSGTVTRLKLLELIVFETLFLVLARALTRLGLLLCSSLRIARGSSVPVSDLFSRVQAHGTLPFTTRVRGPDTSGNPPFRLWSRAWLDFLIEHCGGYVPRAIPARAQRQSAFAVPENRTEFLVPTQLPPGI